MTSEIALKNWLHRDDKTDIQNIEFGMKVWSSIEFNLLTKHEIIIEEFCKILVKLSAKLKTSEDIDSAWTVINEFLALKCSPGAVVSSVKLQLMTTVSDVVKAMKCHRYIVYKGLITLLQNSSMQSFFKSNSKPFAMIVGTSIAFLTNVIESNDVDKGFALKDPLIYEMVKITQTYIKQTPFLNEFRKPFVEHLLLPLSELFIRLRKYDIIDESEYFNILHEIYFADDENQSPMNQLLLQPENENFKFLLNVPVHVFMLIVEGIFQPLKVDTATQALFIQYLFNVYFKQSNDKFANEKEMLLTVSLFLCLLKRYDVSLNFKIGGLETVVYIGKNIESLNVTESNLFEILSIFCASIELNPMMLENSIISLVVKCMLYRKDDKTMAMFERFLMLLIDMYRRLNRSEKFLSSLIRTMWQKLSDFKLSKKFKRKIGTNDVNMSVDEPPKRMRLDTDGNISFGIDSVKGEASSSKWFLQLLSQHINEPDAHIIESSVTDQTVPWKNIQFAWPNRVGEAFSKYISGLVSRPSLVVWKTLVFTLTDYIQLLKQGDSSENTLFLVDWISALLCQYFDGSRLAEQSGKTWDMIDTNRKLQRNLLKDFGSAILSQEHNIRTMNAFLSLCHSSGNFDLLSWFYCPDSITTEQMERSIADNSNDFVHSYLQPTEWGLIEQRITNFGKEECRTNLNRLYLQKMKSKLMLKDSSNETVDMANDLPATTLNGDDGINELNEILMDETTNHWFIQQLTRSQKIQIARKIVELDCDKTTNYNMSSKLLNSVQDREFFDILVVAVFEKISIEAKDPAFVLKRINFDDVFAGNESVCKEVVRGIKNFSLGSDEQLETPFKLLEIFPLGFVSLSVKNILLHLTLSLLRYTSNKCAQSSSKFLTKLLLHGDTIDVFRHLKVKQLPRIFDNIVDISDLELLFKLFFEKSLTEMTTSTTKMLDELLKLLKAETFERKEEFSYMDMSIQLLEFLNRNRKCKELSSQYRDVILAKIRDFFGEKVVHSPGDDQYFVTKTAAGLVKIISMMKEFDDDLKKIINIYFRNMQNCYDTHSIKLLNIMVINRGVFGYTDSDISEVVNKFWNELVDGLHKLDNPDVYQTFVKFVINLKSPEELIDTLTALNSDDADNEDIIKKFGKFEKLFRLIFKCQMNRTKGNICSEFFRQISFQIIIKLRTLPESQNIRHQLLEHQKQLCTSVQIPVSTDLIDDVISFMSETIKYQQIKTIGNASVLKETHARICDLCLSLIQYRHFFVVDRIPQLVVIMKDLLQSVCWYKCNRVLGKQLDDNEVTVLAELSHKMENVVKAFVKHAKDVKRIAPYFLLFVLNLMISKENISTIYPKIKTHFDYICYDLISICDHRVEGFIMRNCNEASKH